MYKIISFLSGFLVGALSSATTVLLMTPKPGQSFRSDIKREVDNILEEGRRASQTRRTQLEQQLAQMRGDSPVKKDSQPPASDK